MLGCSVLVAVLNGAVTLNGGSATDTCDEAGGNDTLISCETVV